VVIFEFAVGVNCGRVALRVEDAEAGAGAGRANLEAEGAAVRVLEALAGGGGGCRCSLKKSLVACSKCGFGEDCRGREAAGSGADSEALEEVRDLGLVVRPLGLETV